MLTVNNTKHLVHINKNEKMFIDMLRQIKKLLGNRENREDIDKNIYMLADMNKYLHT